MIFLKIKLLESDINRLSDCLELVFQDLPLFISFIPEYVFLRFLTIIKMFDGSDTEELESYQQFLDGELDVIGVVSDTIPNTFDSIYDRIQSLEENIKILVEIYKKYKSKMDDAKTTVGFSEKRSIFFA